MTSRAALRSAEWMLRLAGAGLLGAMAGIHLLLYRQGYQEAHVIGPLFLANGILGSTACLAVALVPRRWLTLTSLAGAALAGGTLAGLLVSTHGGLFGFRESSSAPYVTTTEIVESLGIVVLLALTVVSRSRDSWFDRFVEGRRDDDHVVL